MHRHAKRWIGWALAVALAGLVHAAASRAAETATKVPRIGILLLEPRTPGDRADVIARALQGLGYRGDKVEFDVRSAEWDGARLQQLARQLVAVQPDLIIAVTNVAGFAAKEATKTIPIVVTGMHAAVETGLVESLARPGGNVTGVETLAPELDAKRMQLLREIAPRSTRLGVVYNSEDPGARFHLQAVRDAARTLRFEIVPMAVTNPADFDRLLGAARAPDVDAVMTFTDRLTGSNWSRIGAFGHRHRLPTVCEFRFLAQAGCLVTYGPPLDDLFNKAAIQADRILRGTKPADMPVEQVTRFELVVNQRTAKALAIAIPNALLLRADEVIE
jgi:putative ABC transport system substrate-binding protein